MKRERTPMETIISGIAVLIIGIIITANTSSNSVSDPYSPLQKSGTASVFGIIIVLAALILIGVGIIRMRMHGGDDGFDTMESFSERVPHEEAPAPAPAPVVIRVERPAEKTIYCPYCGTAQKADYTICESCGAGRRK